MPRGRGRVPERLRAAPAALVLALPLLLGAGPGGSGETIPLTGREPGERLDVTLTRLVDPADATAAAAATVDNRLVAVRFRLENTGSVVYKDSPASCAHLLDADGRRFAGLNTDTTAGAAFPETVTLDPGGTTEGFVTFHLPDDAALAAVQFALNGGLADDVGQWSLS
ncbi:hypothetical protein [Streptomyces sp. NPDC059874]|uniref:hypothetical protein n=1 Tax=Streptomyces sp. NPDC059874 TaxID=3346983 RepID=UPI003661BA8B